MCLHRLILPITLMLSTLASGQGIEEFLTPADTLNAGRRNWVIGSGVAVGTGTLVALNSFWYADYQKSSFHFVNDNAQWLQVDKIGHGFSSYHLSRFATESLQWGGVSGRESLLYGASAGFIFLSAIEVLDGYSANWGASAGDLAANATGTALFVFQELLWNEQRIVPKYSFHSTEYASARPQVLGESYGEQMLKDYNGQTYWLSANIHSFAKQSKLPQWLNLAVGYGGEGMITGENRLVNTVFLPTDRRYRQFYLSLDADLTKIKTKSHVLQTVFSLINVIKIPAPTLEVGVGQKVKFHFLYF